MVDLRWPGTLILNTALIREKSDSYLLERLRRPLGCRTPLLNRAQQGGGVIVQARSEVLCEILQCWNRGDPSGTEARSAQSNPLTIRARQARLWGSVHRLFLLLGIRKDFFGL